MGTSGNCRMRQYGFYLGRYKKSLSPLGEVERPDANRVSGKEKLALADIVDDHGEIAAEFLREGWPKFSIGGRNKDRVRTCVRHPIFIIEIQFREQFLTVI